MKFTKMQGLGNDYLYVYDEVPGNIKELSIKLSDRHFGVGSDGMIYISHSDIADYKMRIFNADGSEAKMCGNGIRCVGKYVYDKGYTDKTSLDIETQSGIKKLELTVKDSKVSEVCVDMGKAEAKDSQDITLKIPANVNANKDNFIDECFKSESNGELNLLFTSVSTGNPHAVFFVKDMDKLPLSDIGPLVEKNVIFPDGVNAEFVQVISNTELRMRVWERGSGITMACGTGTCASVMAAIVKGFCPRCVPVTVHLDGGDLSIKIMEDNTVFMTGPAEFVVEGDTDIILK